MKIRKIWWNWANAGLAAWVCSVVFHATPAFPAQLPITLKGQWPGFARGTAQGIAVSGHYAYVAMGNAERIVGAGVSRFPVSSLAVFDVSNPGNPKPVGGLDLGGNASGVLVVGNFAYVADGDAGLVIVDVSNPAKPRRVGGLATDGSANGVQVVGNLAYVADEAGLQFIDISSPAQPKRIGGYTGSVPWGFHVKGIFAFLASGWDGFQVIDVSNPAKPALVGTLVIAGSNFGVQVVGDYAYVRNLNSGLQVIDVSDPTRPVLVGGILDPVNPDLVLFLHDFAVLGNLAYLPDTSGLQIIDVSDPAKPMRVGGYAPQLYPNRWRSTGYALAANVVGNYAYLMDALADVQIIDVSNPAKPARVGELDSSGESLKMQVAGNHAYVADRLAGLRVIDVSNPASPVRVGSLATGDYVNDLRLVGNFLFLANGYSGLLVIDASDPANPTEVSSVDLGEYVDSIQVVGSYAYVTGYDFFHADDVSNLHVIDVSNPARPTRIRDYPTRYANSVRVDGNYAYVTDSQYGLLVIDLNADPAPIQPWPWVFGLGSLDLAAHYAYVAVNQRLIVFDISTPLIPKPVGSIDTKGQAGHVQVLGHYAFLTELPSGLEVFDISNPANPMLAGAFPTRGPAWGVQVIGDSIYVAEGGYGVELLQIQNPASLLDPLHPTFLDHGTLLPGPSFRLQWAGGQGNISLETSTDLNVWKELTTQPASLDPVTFTHPTGDPAQARFYRLVARP